jgi:DNA-directed RNA polymerase specialized sigma subunit
MAQRESDEHFRQFKVSLERAREVYGQSDDETFLARQKRQVDTLIFLEKQFQQALLETPYGVKVYEAFIEHICVTRGNILDARPFFRERQRVFTKYISKALRARRVEGLIRFRFNFRFVQFALGYRRWGKTSVVAKLARDIAAAREELITMNMPLAVSRARIFYSRTPKAHLAYMDLIQIACEGLMSGIDKFVPPFSKVFRSVAIGRMVGNFIEATSVDEDTILHPCNQKPKKIKDFKPGDKILGVNNEGCVVETTVVALHDHGVIQGWEATFDDGFRVVCSKDHKFLTDCGMVPLKEIWGRDLGVFCEPAVQAGWVDSRLRGSVYDEEEAALPQKDLSVMSGRNSPEEEKGCDSSGFSEYQGRGLDESLWGGVSKEKKFVLPQKDLRDLQSWDFGGEERGLYSLASGESRSRQEEVRRCEVYLRAAFESGSEIRKSILGKGKGSERGLAKCTSRGVCRQYEKGASGLQAFQDGGVVEVERRPGLGECSDALWGRSQTSRLRISRSQDLGGGGWPIPFLRNLKETPQASEDSGARRDAKCRVSATWRRDSDQAGNDVLRKQYRENEGQLAPLAQADAPLASTGGLVRRRIVRVRAVGTVRMCDLEVAHPKHNFLLPNGVVTSNSETFIHFYPVDKRRIYRANKQMGRNSGDIDQEELVNRVNSGVDAAHRTNASELANLMAAASVVSTETTVSGDDEEKARTADRYAAPADCQPDVIVERSELMRALVHGMAALNPFEKKLLALKGVQPTD